MSERRRLLEIIASQGKWLPYSFEYLYHSLIPQKVNKNAELPQEYQEVEYIESSGTQYIDSGLSMPNGFHIKAKASGSQGCLFGAYTDNNIDRNYFSYGSQNRYLLGYGGFTYFGTYDSDTHLLNMCNIYNHRFAIVDGTSYQLDSSSTQTYSTKNLFVLGQNANGTPANLISGKLYFLQVYSSYDESVLIRNFIPCYRKSDNVIGLFDVVNQVFYTNAGTGTFAKGNDVYRLVKNKAKAVKIYGNSEVENQLIETNDTTSSNGITLTNNGDGSFTLSGLATATAYLKITKNVISFTNTHKYLFWGFKTGNNNVYAYFSNPLTNITDNAIYTEANETTRNIFFQVSNGTDLRGTNAITITPQIIDLTQRYPFNTPTTLTDNRVQNIINRGYIPFNSGEIKNVDMSELMSEPYNLFDNKNAILDSGYYAEDGTTTQNQYWVITTNYTRINANTSYQLHHASNSGNAPCICFYDSQFNFISAMKYGGSSAPTFTTPLGTSYCRLSIHKELGVNGVYICRSSVNYGFKPHTQPQTIPFKYQGAGVGTSHDTMTIYNDRVEFVKEFLNYQFTGLPAVEDWQWYGADNLNFWYFTPVLNQKAGTNNLCSNGIKVRFAGAGGSVLRVLQSENPQINSSTDMNALFNSSVSMLYQRNTPQVITIPRKHLGIVDLGSLNWTYDSNTQQFKAIISSMAQTTGASNQNLYCARYLTNYANQNGNIYHDRSNLIILDNRYNNATDLKNSLQGQYLFYETENEVADITDMINIEAGGTLTSDSKVLPNADMKLKSK